MIATALRGEQEFATTNAYPLTTAYLDIRAAAQCFLWSAGAMDAMRVQFYFRKSFESY